MTKAIPNGHYRRRNGNLVEVVGCRQHGQVLFAMVHDGKSIWLELPNHLTPVERPPDPPVTITVTEDDGEAD